MLLKEQHIIIKNFFKGIKKNKGKKRTTKPNNKSTNDNKR